MGLTKEEQRAKQRKLNVITKAKFGDERFKALTPRQKEHIAKVKAHKKRGAKKQKKNERRARINKKIELNNEDTYLVRKKLISNKDYNIYMKSPEWKAKKDIWISSGNFSKCLKDGCNDTKIDFHHLSYGNLFTKKEIKDIIPLCRKHHGEVHLLAKSLDIPVRKATNMLIER